MVIRAIKSGTGKITGFRDTKTGKILSADKRESRKGFQSPEKFVISGIKKASKEIAKIQETRAKAISRGLGKISVKKGRAKFEPQKIAPQRIQTTQNIQQLKQEALRKGLRPETIDILQKEKSLGITQALNRKQAQQFQSNLLKQVPKKKIDILKREELKRRAVGIRKKDFIADIKKARIEANKRAKQNLNMISPPPKIERSNWWKQTENNLANTYNRILKKSPERRTTKENFLIVASGTGAAAFGTIRKVPNVVWETLSAIVRPDLMAKSIITLATNKNARGQVLNEISRVGQSARRGNPDAISSIAAQVVGTKLGTKLGGAIQTEAGKVVSVTQPVRRIQEARFILKQPKEIRPFVKTILKSARIQEKLKPTDLKGIKKINFNEVSELNKIEASALKRTLKETDSFVFGSLPARAISRGRTKIPKDVDLATKNKNLFLRKFLNNLPKNQRKIYQIKGEKLINTKTGVGILDIKGYNRLRPDQTIFGTGRLPINTIVYRTNKPRLQQAGLKIPTQRLVQIEGIKLIGFGEQTSRKALGTLQVILEKGARRAKDPAAFVESLEIQLAGLRGRIPKTKFVKKYLLNRKAQELENSIKILKSKAFSKLLDKKVPGLTKEFPIIKKISKLNTKQKIAITKKVTNRIKKIVDKKKVKVKKKIIKKVVKKIVAKKIVAKKIKAKVKVKKISKLPKKKPSKIPRVKRKPSRVPRIKKKKPSRIPKVKKKPSRLPPSKLPKKKPSRIPVIKKKPSKLPVTKVPSKIPVSRLPVTKVPSKIPGIITPITKSPPKTIKKILIKSNLPTTKNFRNAFIIKIKKGNKVLRQSTKGLPLKRAKNLARQLTDQTIGASHTLTKVGRTNIKDVNKILLKKKFRKKKSRNPKVQKEVEKRKFRLDKKGETKGIRKRTTVKRVSNNKRVKKKKKSPLKRSKKLKAKKKKIIKKNTKKKKK